MRPLCGPTVKTVLGLNRWAHNAPTMCPLCARYASTMYVFKPFRGFWGEFDGSTNYADYATMRPHADYGLRTDYCRANAVTVLNRFGVNSMGAQCAQYALNMRPIRAHYVPPVGFNRFGVKSMGPQCAHYAPVDGPMGLWARDGPTMHPTMRRLCLNRLGLWGIRWAHSAPNMRPLCAHYVFGVKSMGLQCAHYAPTIRRLCV